jgi:hypothetical protein
MSRPLSIQVEPFVDPDGVRAFGVTVDYPFGGSERYQDFGSATRAEAWSKAVDYAVQFVADLAQSDADEVAEYSVEAAERADERATAEQDAALAAYEREFGPLS